MDNENSPRSNVFDQLRKIGIERQDSQWLGGVAAGIAQRFNIDVVLVRGVFVALSLLGGTGFLVYGLAWGLLPGPKGTIPLERAVHGKDWTSALTGALVFLLIGFFLAPWLLSTVAPILWPLLVVAGILFVIFSRRDTKFAGTSKPRRTPKPSDPAPGSVVEKPWRAQRAQSFSTQAPVYPEQFPPATKPLRNPETTHPHTDKSNADSEEDSMDPEPRGFGHIPQDHGPQLDPHFAKANKKLRNAPPVPGWVATIIVGVTILTVALVLAADYLGAIALPGNGWGTAFAIGLFVVGLALVFVSLAHRTSGGLLGLAIPLLVLTVIFGGNDFRGMQGETVGVATDSNQYSSVFSKSTVDLRHLSTITEPTTVEVSSVFSKVDLELPTNIPVQIQADGLFLSSLNENNSQPTGGFAADAPTLTVVINGVFSGYDPEYSSDGTGTSNPTF
ncbi:PspC domain-containing protein [Glutamicibacter sp. AOP12-B1-11]|uniref:PspC domain-containing protein n=1 Tax=Glutamicibacter sp. AOP12-B1-11 TaxID=3457725 RepID=UPI004033BAD6